MRIGLTHTTRLDYDASVVEGVMDTRLGPHSDAHQRWERYHLQLAPNGSVRTYTDGFGNTAHMVSVSRPHSFVEVTSTGVVETLLTDPFAMPAAPPRPLSSAEQFDSLRPSRLVAITDAVREMAAPHWPSAQRTALDAARALMELIFDQFTYEKDVTSVTTTVPELLDSRTGVCQDFAHVLIALCRAVAIPARYVSGYIVMDDSAGAVGASENADQPTRGAGASHAWAEVWTDTHGWRGFDPTNNLLASEHHIKMATGRDYGDVAPTRGTFRGSAEERLSVDVRTVVI